MGLRLGFLASVSLFQARTPLTMFLLDSRFPFPSLSVTFLPFCLNFFSDFSFFLFTFLFVFFFFFPSLFVDYLVCEEMTEYQAPCLFWLSFFLFSVTKKEF
jgi:hypothetical protein